MRTTLKIALLMSSMMVATAASANDNRYNEERDGYHNSQRIEGSKSSRAERVAARERAEADRLNRENPHAGYERRHETRWLGMRATDYGTKDGSDNDSNNRSAHNFVMGKKATNVVKH